jgi:hypothetical protein
MIRVQDLPTNPEYRTMLHCERCGENYSATRGDYFLAAPDQIMRCCGRVLKLVRQETRYIPVRGN